jgi:acyl transferase domain-containing protein
VKSNVGHTQAAAGIMSVIKLVLALQHSALPRTLHAGKPTGAIDWFSGTIRLLTDSVDWPKSGRTRRAGVSSFGISGTDSHALLEEPPEASDCPRTADPASAQAPWVLSAKDPATLKVMAARLYEVLDANPDVPAADVGNALANSRSLFAHRAAIMPGHDGRHDRGLTALAKGIPSPDVVAGMAPPDSPTVFVFPGHGTHWTAMAAQLMAESEVFAATIAECEKALGSYVSWSLGAVLRGDAGAPVLDGDAEIVQPATFAVMVALAALWRSNGVSPDAIVGHSQGDVAAACVAGALSMSDAVRIVAARARLLNRIAGLGGMVALAVDHAEAQDRLARWQQQLCVAVVNGPRSVVASGDSDALTELLDDARRAGITAKRIPGDIAFHSPHVERLAAEFGSLLSGIRPMVTAIPFYSATTATQVRGDRLDPDYWCRNMRAPVDLDATTRALYQAGYRLFIEVSPHPVLSPAIEQSTAELGPDARVVATLRRDAGGMRDFLRSLAEAHVHGATVDWRRVFGDQPADASWLPTYPFRSRPFWLAPQARADVSSGAVVEHGESSPTALPTKRERAELLTLVLQTVATVGERTDSLPPAATTDFGEYGLTSLDGIEVRNMLAAALGVSLPATIVMNHRTPEKLAGYLVELLASTEPVAALADATGSASEDHLDVGTEVPPGFEAVYRSAS